MYKNTPKNFPIKLPNTNSSSFPKQNTPFRAYTPRSSNYLSFSLSLSPSPEKTSSRERERERERPDSLPDSHNRLSARRSFAFYLSLSLLPRRGARRARHVFSPLEFLRRWQPASSSSSWISSLSSSHAAARARVCSCVRYMVYMVFEWFGMCARAESSWVGIDRKQFRFDDSCVWWYDRVVRQCVNFFEIQFAYTGAEDISTPRTKKSTTQSLFTSESGLSASKILSCASLLPSYYIFRARNNSDRYYIEKSCVRCRGWRFYYYVIIVIPAVRATAWINGHVDSFPLPRNARALERRAVMDSIVVY